MVHRVDLNARDRLQAASVLHEIFGRGCLCNGQRVNSSVQSVSKRSNHSSGSSGAGVNAYHADVSAKRVWRDFTSIVKLHRKTSPSPPYDELGGGGIAFVTSSNTRTRLNCFTCWSLPTFCTFLAKGAFTRTPDSWSFCITIIKGVAVIRFESKFFDRISKWISSKLDLDGKEKKNR